MKKKGWGKSKFLIDGFPRDKDNYEKWLDMMEDLIDLRFLLYIECSKVCYISFDGLKPFTDSFKDSMKRRILKRSMEDTDINRIDDNVKTL